MTAIIGPDSAPSYRRRMSSPFEHQTLGDIVARNYQAAAVFDRQGLDFCCGGRSSLAEACRERFVDVDTVLAELEQLDQAREGVLPRSASDLIDEIVSRHHSYVRDHIPIITAHLAKVVAAHGARHPELAAITAHFEVLAHELVMHMLKEEQVLFPFIRALDRAVDGEAAVPPDVFGTVQNPIRMMEIEHRHAGEELGTIRGLSSDLTPPGDACATYRVVYQELRAFEQDLHRHVHLENNVLFPWAVELEAKAAPYRSSGR